MKKLKRNISRFGLLAGLVCSNIAIANINSVVIGKMRGDTAAAEFSTIINFAPASDLPNWQFGFYMPRPFIKQQNFIISGILRIIPVCRKTFLLHPITKLIIYPAM